MDDKNTGTVLETTSSQGVKWERNSYISDSITPVGGWLTHTGGGQGRLDRALHLDRVGAGSTVPSFCFLPATPVPESLY